MSREFTLPETGNPALGRAVVKYVL